MFKFLVVLAASLCVAYAAMSLGRVEPKPERFKHQEGCYVKDLDRVIPFGSFKHPSYCMELRCGEEFIEYVSCGTAATSPPCKIVEDKDKLYPKCCPRIVCP